MLRTALGPQIEGWLDVPPLLAELEFRGRTLLGNSRLAVRCAESGTCDFNDL